jgi:hypothetical protein
MEQKVKKVRKTKFLKAVIKKVKQQRRELRRDENIGKLGCMSWARRVKQLQERAQKKQTT